MKKEYYFIIALFLFGTVLFTVGSRAGLVLQSALRRGFDPESPRPEVLTASFINISKTAEGMRVPVYSQYPLNLKNQLSIAAGTTDGVSEGDVAIADGYLAGIVEKAFERSALVQTIFDKRFQTPVRIGNSGADALLRGGNDPELTLIPADATISEGDLVYAAGQGMPYGKVIGSLKNIRESGDRVFKEAILSVPYSAGTLEEVMILASHQ